MSMPRISATSAPRRVRIERGIYRRYGNGVYEVGYYDDDGKQRWRTVDGGIEEARKLRLYLHRGRGRNQRLRADLLQISKVADTITPTKRLIIMTMQATKGNRQREAWLQLAASSLAMARKFDR
jgi:hypothetical protein